MALSATAFPEAGIARRPGRARAAEIMLPLPPIGRSTMADDEVRRHRRGHWPFAVGLVLACAGAGPWRRLRPRLTGGEAVRNPVGPAASGGGGHAAECQER